MAARKAFLLRLDPATHEALERWAGAELRSLNAQIEFLLRRALQDAGRLRPAEEALPAAGNDERPHGGQEE
ncbi:MAG: hypothetical protein LAP87_27555 [Acidobacteriia bacterium]|nr:hypothetical protein [Terriglobia bacterium]